MADATEDIIQQPQEDVDAADEVADFRFLSSQKLPSRGTKDFEHHGTKLQQSTLEASRQAMYDVLNQTRTHLPSMPRAIWDEESGGAWVINPSGKWTATAGQARRCPGKGTRLWLLPEEMLWLIDRGSLDVRWPAKPEEEEENGLPMSLQGAYAVCIRKDSLHPLSLEMYSVYAYLKRAGYCVIRANSSEQSTAVQDVPKSDIQQFGFLELCQRLFTKQDNINRRKLGPLVTPGLYRDYASIFQNLDAVPFHDPCSNTQRSCDHGSQLKVTFHVYKPNPDYKKTSPSPPDFCICVLDARKSLVPTEPELDGLLNQTPFHAPRPNQSLNRKLKDGYRNVILAVVDQGTISFLNVSDAGFGLEKVWMGNRKHMGRKMGKKPPVRNSA